MILVALRGLLSRKLRTALTSAAIVLGVSMISGTYILTDTINSSFTAIFQTADRHIDVVINSKSPVSSTTGFPPSLPGSILTLVRGTPGVAAAAGEIADQTQIYDLRGRSLGAVGGAPNLLFSLPPPRFRASSLVTGRWPHGNEIAIDNDTARKRHLRIGQVVQLTTISKLERFTVVAFTRFGSVASFGGAAVIDAPLAAAQRIAGKVGRYDVIDVAAAPGVSSRLLISRLHSRIPTALRGRTAIKTGQQNANDQAAAIGHALNFLTIALLAFGGIAVFVGAFIIFNTFSITVAQRAREFALLRTLGATRRQVMISVVLEALLLGLAASLVGLLAGLGIARGLNALFVAFGIDLPAAGLVVQTRTIMVAMLVGTVVTVVSSVMPAVRATRVPPIAALREGAQLPRGRFARYTPLAALVLTAAGITLLTFGVLGAIPTTSERLTLIGIGAGALFVGVAMFTPQLVPPLAGAIGWPIERFTNIAGRLARENTMRNPGRTAVTAAALMIGLALVGFVTIFAAELVKTTDDTMNRNYAGSFTVQSSNFGLLPSGIAPALAHVPGVGIVSPLKGDNARIDGIGEVSLTGVQSRTLAPLYHFQIKSGGPNALGTLGTHNALIDDTFATDHHLAVGAVLRLTTPAGRHDTFQVAGIYANTIFFPNLVVPYSTFQADWQQSRDQLVLAGLAKGATLGPTEARIAALLLHRFPVAQVQSTAQYKRQQQSNVNRLLGLIYLLLAMSVIVSLFGIVNTLVLSVYERTREIGMLRAIGSSRSQIRWIIRWESVITSVIGAVLGLVLGIILALIVTAGLASQGIERALPLGQLLIWVLIAVLFGIVAAAFPARRAARLDVLQAITYE